jgi:pimeloyl-ACP methyl ester carboxylesterase
MSAPASRRVELDTGLGYHVLEWSDAARDPDHTVVLVHGFLDLGWGWTPAVDAGLAEHFHVIAPDMRGHGDSERIGAGGYYHFLDYVADLRSLIAALGRERVSLVGHSMGGSICAYYAGAFPDEVHRLALLEGTGPPETASPAGEHIRRWIAAWRQQRAAVPRSYPSVADAAARLQQHDPLLTDELALVLAERGTRDDGHGGRTFKHDPLHLTMGPYPFKVELSRELWTAIPCPVLLVEGSASQLRHPPAEAERRHSCFADRRYVLLEGAAHMMQRHRPRELAQLLIEFLAEPASQPMSH